MAMDIIDYHVFGAGSGGSGLMDKLLGAGRRLLTGESLFMMRVDTGCLVAMQASVEYDIQYVGKIKTALFGGEGLFFATLRGPGLVPIQSLPFSRLANRIYAVAPRRGGRSNGE